MSPEGEKETRSRDALVSVERPLEDAKDEPQRPRGDLVQVPDCRSNV